MRTTIDIPDPLLKKAKIKAVEKGISLKDFFTELLEKELHSEQPNQPVAPWKSLQGKGSAASLNPTDTPFDDYSGPDWIQSVQVNEPE